MTTIKPRKYSVKQMIEMIVTLEVEDKVKLWQWLEKDIKESQQPWLKTAGIFQEDPTIELNLVYILNRLHINENFNSQKANFIRISFFA